MNKLILLILIAPLFANATPTQMPSHDPCFENVSLARDAVAKTYLQKIWQGQGEVLTDVIVSKTALHPGGATLEVFALLKYKSYTRLAFFWLDGGRCEPIESDPFHYPQAILFQ